MDYWARDAKEDEGHPAREHTKSLGRKSICVGDAGKVRDGGWACIFNNSGVVGRTIMSFTVLNI